LCDTKLLSNGFEFEAAWYGGRIYYAWKPASFARAIFPGEAR
jgi:hypothetical protein